MYQNNRNAGSYISCHGIISSSYIQLYICQKAMWLSFTVTIRVGTLAVARRPCTIMVIRSISDSETDAYHLNIAWFKGQFKVKSLERCLISK